MRKEETLEKKQKRQGYIMCKIIDHILEQRKENRPKRSTRRIMHIISRMQCNRTLIRRIFLITPLHHDSLPAPQSISCNHRLRNELRVDLVWKNGVSLTGLPRFSIESCAYDFVVMPHSSPAWNDLRKLCCELTEDSVSTSVVVLFSLNEARGRNCGLRSRSVSVPELVIGLMLFPQ